jgi:hypothetical protein
MADTTSTTGTAAGCVRPSASSYYLAGVHGPDAARLFDVGRLSP